MSSITSIFDAGRPQSILVPEPRTTVDNPSSDRRFSVAAASRADEGWTTSVAAGSGAVSPSFDMTARVRKHPRRWLHAVGEAGCLGRVASIGTRHFPTEARGGKHLARIAEAARIEHRAHALHQREIFGGEHRRHVLRLVGADAMLAGERPSGIDAVAQDLGGDFDRLFGLAGDPLVVADQRVQVAVAGVEHVADAQTRSLLQIAD